MLKIALIGFVLILELVVNSLDLSLKRAAGLTREVDAVEEAVAEAGLEALVERRDAFHLVQRMAVRAAEVASEAVEAPTLVKAVEAENLGNKAETDSVYDTEKLSERVAKLSGGVAVIKVDAVVGADGMNSRVAKTLN
jgi:2-polyprenyl-6-methoxyphenol hydroxylase-like FAD-dependent oxidoreductase